MPNDHTDYIDQRRAEELTDAAVLHALLQPCGWRGSLCTVQRYLRPLRPPATKDFRVPAKVKAAALERCRVKRTA